MIVGIISDTHDRLDKISEAVAFFNSQKCDIILHAGDFVAPFSVKALHKMNAKIIAVFGNNDGELDGIRSAMRKQDKLYHGPHSFELAGKMFMLMHEPAHLAAASASGDYDFIIYGHLHIKEYKPGPPVIINPGECCGWVSGCSSVALLDTDSGNVSFQDL